MKLHALCASAVALTLAFTSPASAISQQEKDYASLVVVSWVVSAACNNAYTVVEGGPRKAADRNGVDFDSVSPAIIAAFKAQFDLEYERSDLIPEITLAVRDTLQAMNVDFNKNKAKACAKWGEAVLPVQMIRRK